MKLKPNEQSKFKGLVMPLLDDLHRLAYFLCNDESDAEDLVAESIRKACEKFSSLMDHSKIKPWLIRILRNTFLNSCRDDKKHQIVEYTKDINDDDAHFSLFTEISQPFLLWWGNPERELLDKLMGEDIQQALADLPCEYRFVVILCDVEGFSYKEISDTLNLPAGTVRSRIARGRSMLQKKLYHHALDRGIIQNQTMKQQDEKIRDQ